jgi:predicted phage-related endonuclease
MNAIVFIPAIAVDELASVKASIAELQKREKALTAALKATGMERIIGTLHEATVSLSERETVDTKQLREDYPELVEPYLRTSLVETLRITARRTS